MKEHVTLIKSVTFLLKKWVRHKNARLKKRKLPRPFETQVNIILQNYKFNY